MGRTKWFCLLLAGVLLSAVECAINNDLSSRLQILSTDRLTLPTVIGHLRSIVKEKTTVQRSELEQDLEITECFLKQLYRDQPEGSTSKIFTSRLIYQLTDKFAVFKSQWLRDMYLKLMEELGLDMKDPDLVAEALKNPDKFDLNYESYRVLLKPYEDE